MRHFSWVVGLALVMGAAAGCSEGGAGEGEAEAVTVSEETVELRFAVKGMTCQGCADFVQKKMSTIEGVQACAVSLEEAEATVIAQSPATATTVLAEFDDGGYTLRTLRKPP